MSRGEKVKGINYEKGSHNFDLSLDSDRATLLFNSEIKHQLSKFSNIRQSLVSSKENFVLVEKYWFRYLIEKIISSKRSYLYIKTHLLEGLSDIEKQNLFNKAGLNKSLAEYSVAEYSYFDLEVLNLSERLLLQNLGAVRIIFVFFVEASGVVVNHKITGKRWADTWNGNRRALQTLKNPWTIMDKYCELMGCSSDCMVSMLDWPACAVVACCDYVKVRTHEHFDKLPSEARAFLDIQLFAGYPKMEDRDLSDDPVAWLETDVPSSYDAEWWYNQFTKTFWLANKWPNSLFMNLKTFVCSRWLWITQGASPESRALYDGERWKTKLGAALSLTDDELLSRVDTAITNGGEFGVFLKSDEKGYKRRLIVNVSLGGYILAAYVRYIIQNFVGDSPAFAKLETTIVDAVDVITLIRQGHLMMPLDESAYDYHVTADSLEGFNLFLVRQFPNSGLEAYVRMCEKSKWRFGDRKGRWKKGMPSGLALTSLLNSWMNYIKQTTIIPTSPIHYAAGDDVLCASKSQIDLDLISREYKKFGADINIKKNWLSYSYAEFLKELYSGEGITGYPARIYASLIYAGRESTFLPSAKLAELSELWKQFFDRMGLPFNETLVAQDLARAISRKVERFTSQTARLWLRTPKALGGFGRSDDASVRFIWKTTVLEKKKYTELLWSIPPVIVFDDKVELRIEKFNSKIIQPQFGPPAKLPPVATLEEWIARLNNEHLDNKYGIFKDMIYGVIPLPTVDFISSRRMSEFATNNLANVRPNIGGGWNKTTNRLINCAKAMRIAVQHYTWRHRLKVLA